MSDTYRGVPHTGVDRAALDPERVAVAQRRIDAALAVAEHHQRMATSARAEAEAIARTWGIEIGEN